MSEAAIRAAFAQRIDTYDTPSPIDYQNARLAPDHFAPQLTGPDEVALSRFIDQDGTFTVVRIPVAALAATFGALFAAGKPVGAAFVAACVAAHNAEWVGPCAICRNAEKFKAEGILA